MKNRDGEMEVSATTKLRDWVNLEKGYVLGRGAEAEQVDMVRARAWVEKLLGERWVVGGVRCTVVNNNWA